MTKDELKKNNRINKLIDEIKDELERDLPPSNVQHKDDGLLFLAVLVLHYHPIINTRLALLVAVQTALDMTIKMDTVHLFAIRAAMVFCQVMVLH